VIEQILSKYRGLRSKLNGSNVRKEAVAWRLRHNY
jgi:hypothetical protein